MDATMEMQRLMRQLESLSGRTPAPPPIVQPEPTPTNLNVSVEQLGAIVEEGIKKAFPQLFDMVGKIDAFFAKALPPADLEAFKKYRDEGAPGLQGILASDKLYPVAQLLWEEIKEASK